jgi:hypothetical protein
MKEVVGKSASSKEMSESWADKAKYFFREVKGVREFPSGNVLVVEIEKRWNSRARMKKFVFLCLAYFAQYDDLQFRLFSCK